MRKPDAATHLSAEHHRNNGHRVIDHLKSAPIAGEFQHSSQGRIGSDDAKGR
jgi:hypothetical protein